LAGIVGVFDRRIGDRSMTAFEGRRVLVIGLGRSGRASVTALLAHGATVVATDEQQPERLSEAISAIAAQGARFASPAELRERLDGFELAVLSPGIPQTARVVADIVASGVPIVGEVELAYRLRRAPIVAVTGTKGKSTTTALIGHLLDACGLRARVGGNIGNALVGEVDAHGEYEWIVAELSSFQLETVTTFHARVAVLLNLAPDHLDRYDSMDDYARAKYNVFARQDAGDWFVGNAEDARVAGLRDHDALRAQQLWFTLSDSLEGAGMYVRDGMLIFSPGDGRQSIEVARASSMPLPGAHNVQNAMAALLAAIAAGCDPVRAGSALATFGGLPHRLERIVERAGVAYVDDSKSTTPHSTIAALRSFSQPIVLIAGGRAKGGDFDELGREIRDRVKTLIPIGEAGPEIARASSVAAAPAASMREAVERACDAAAPGDVVLLSPACASFDMFASAEDRGERFAEAVAGLEERARA
jgi:UDP-N-acetylmuramoylalanine--D-glutamate ligase